MRSVGDTTTAGLVPISVSGGRVNAARAVDARGPAAQPQRPRRNLVVVRSPTTTASSLNDRRSVPGRLGRGTLTAARTPTPTASATTDDNCTSHANAGQADDDGDRLGNACDPTPRGEDPDGDAQAEPRRRVPDGLRHARQRLPRADHAAADGAAESRRRRRAGP